MTYNSSDETKVSFHDELRERNRRALGPFAAVCVAGFWLWTAFDYYLSPSNWQTFLWWRSTVGAVCVVLAVVGSHRRFCRFTWEATWLLMLAMTACVAAMLPRVGGALVYYLVGFALALIAGAAVPLWPPRWSLTFSLTSIAIAVALGPGSGHSFATQELVMGAFVLTTVFVGSNLIPWVVHRLIRQDYLRKRQLEAATDSARRAMQELADANAQLEEVSAQRQRLFHNISHELRTPLTMIITPLDGMLQGAFRGNEDLDSMRRNAHRILRHVDEILELAKIDSGTLKLHVEKVDLIGLARAMTRNFKSGARASGIELRWQGDATETVIHGDAHRLEMVLNNLIGNAIKYTPEGGTVEVAAKRVNQGVRVSITDSGPGIPEEIQEKIFDRFVQSSNARAGGVGIGLALAKEIVELHGGELHLQSEVGEGTTFLFTLPPNALELTTTDETSGEVDVSRGFTSTPPMQPPAPDGSASPARDRRASTLPPSSAPEGTVLVVDDEPEMRSLIKRILSRRYRVLTASGGHEALRVIADERPDVVLSDVMMAAGDGASLLTEIRKHPDLKGLPVVMLTAKGEDATQVSLLKLGADDFLSKPFKEDVLLARVRLQFRLRKLMIELARSEKLVSLGTLAAGILHEINNPGGAIQSASHALTPELSPKDLRTLKEIIEVGIARILGLTEAVRLHIRPAERGTVFPFPIGEGLRASVAILQGAIKDNYTVEVDCDESLEAFAEPAQANQIFLNLMENAVKSGATRIKVRAVDRRAHLEVTVSDNGPGIPAADRDRIFDPFFTTRDIGEGTGLGLAMVRVMADAIGGTVELRPSPEGACFAVTLPKPPEPSSGGLRKPARHLDHKRVDAPNRELS